jgi:hypothetical protein
MAKGRGQAGPVDTDVVVIGPGEGNTFGGDSFAWLRAKRAAQNGSSCYLPCLCGTIREPGLTYPT